MKSSPANKQNVSSYPLLKILLRMFAAAGSRDICRRSLEYLEQRLLHTLARNIRVIDGLSSLRQILSDLVDIDDSLLSFFEIAARGLNEPKQDVLDILAYISGSVRIVASTIQNGTSGLWPASEQAASCRFRWGRSTGY